MLRASRRRSSRSWILALSLGLNLFLAGWAVTQYLRPSVYSKPGVAPEVIADAIAGSLPAADGDLMRKAFAERRNDLRAAREAYLVTFDHFRQVITADPPSAAAIAAGMEEVKRTRQLERQIFSDTMVDVLPRLSRDGRQAFVASHLGGRP
ncbi:MAG: periplasmic heavy metal sensor [Telmatospirillum sp.]|nr:periplasmic heavy metal sensor [Telmatospirillum sp.]